MDYKSLMVHLDLEPTNDARLRVAGQLAAHFGAKTIGIAASDPQPPVYADGIVASSLVAQDRRRVEGQMKEAKRCFTAEMAAQSVECEWREAFEKPAMFVAQQARAADLIVTGLGCYEVLGDPRYVLDPSELVIQAGRPLLIVPPEVAGLSAKNIVVGWKNTREARRAVWDALPLLQRAENVVVATVREFGAASDAAAGVDDVIKWLAVHEVAASKRTFDGSGDTAEALAAIVSDELADLLVTGAYGHSRLGEWIWGGVTQRLLSSSETCCLLSH